MASLGVHELQTQQEGAAAAVAALYFCCLAGTVLNLRLTGFKLYIPVSIAAAVRGVSFAARAAYYVNGNINLMALTRALQAIGLGISIAMCSCFLVVWMRNARPSHQPSALPAPLTVLCKLLVACVIALGPFLGISAAAMLGAKPKDLHLQGQAMEIREASMAGFLAVIGLLTLCTAFVAINWLRGSAGSKQQRQQQQQQQLELPQTQSGKQQQQQQLSWQDQQEWQDSTPMPTWQQQLRGDGLILLLLACDLLLLWSSAANVVSLSHPELQTQASLYYPLLMLPELLVAVIWAMPSVTARVALGARFGEWRQQQVLQRRAASDANKSAGKSADSSSDAADAEALADGPVGDLVKATAV